MRRTLETMAALVALAACAAGCGSSGTIWVTGKVQKGGAAYKAPDGQKLGVTFYAMEVTDPSGKKLTNLEPYVADLDPADGSFRVPGAEGKGIPPGKYRVAISQRLTREAVARASKTRRKPVDRDADALETQFGVASSPIVRELKESCELTIDLDHPVTN